MRHCAGQKKLLMLERRRTNVVQHARSWKPPYSLADADIYGSTTHTVRVEPRPFLSGYDFPQYRLAWRLKVLRQGYVSSGWLSPHSWPAV
jgi:hypothetical protein